jgi:PAS domain S-box-containing protein
MDLYKWLSNISSATEAKYFNNVFSQFSNPVFLLSSDGKILKCNHAVLELYGLSSAQFLNQDYFVTCKKHHIQPAFSSLDEILKQPSQITITQVHNPHLEKTIQWIASLIKYKTEDHICLQGFDISPTKLLQNSIIDHLPNHSVFWKDKNGIYLGCNKAFAVSLGFKSPSDVIGKTDYDLPVKKEESDAYRADDKEVMESRKPKLNIEETQTLINDESRILLTSKIPLVDEYGNIYGVLGIYSDITKQKNNELQLIEINKQLEKSFQEKSGLDKQLRESIIDHLPNHFIFWKDKNSVFLGCNKAFASSANLTSPEEIVGKTDYDLPWSKEESDSYRADDNEVMNSKVPKLNIEEPQTLINGKQIILTTSKVPLFNDNGEVYGVLAIYSDITEQKSNEKKLIETFEKLEKASQVKSDFVRNISHDIRTPLAGIQQTMRAIAERKISEEEVPEYAFAAWEASNKLMELFNQIIDVSKKENFDTHDRIVKFDLFKILQDLKETYTVVAKHKGLTLDIEYAENLPHYLLGKHIRLHRILMNLIGNALKFTEKGSVKLVVEKSRKTDDKIILRFSVIDTGIGIPQEKQGIIFELFSRLNPSFQGNYPGSGLGLHVVKDYVEKMQGEIYVESDEGKGSMFTCVLPFKEPILDNDNDVIETEYFKEISSNEIVYFDKKPVRPKPIPNTDSATKNKVLLVEDDKLAQNMGALILQELGYSVEVAKSGEEALELTSKVPYDLIYMDVGLPKIDGIETTKQIRNDNNNLCKNTFIVALTAHADEEISNACITAGMQHILFKPLTEEKAQQIKELLSSTDNQTIDKKIIDFDLWRSRLGAQSFMLDELFHMLAKDFSSTREEIINAYESNDLPKLKAVTHKMKGGLKYCGLPKLEAAIIAIEAGAKNNDKNEVDKWYQATLNALDDTQKAYHEWSKNHSN